MQVCGLFECFANYPDKILFYDATENVQSTVFVRRNGELFPGEYYEFLMDYGDYDVRGWSYSHDDNAVSIDIEKRSLNDEN